MSERTPAPVRCGSQAGQWLDERRELVRDARAVLLSIVEAVNAGDLAEVERITRNDRMVESFRRLTVAFPDVSVTVEWVIAEGDRAVGWAHITGTHGGLWRGLEPTSRPIDVRGMLAIEVRADGSVADFWLANDWLSIAQQIGVPLHLP
jgi:predicted ester cyclase